MLNDLVGELNPANPHINAVKSNERSYSIILNHIESSKLQLDTITVPKTTDSHSPSNKKQKIRGMRPV
jgi:hypothetical protein